MPFLHDILASKERKKNRDCCAKATKKMAIYEKEIWLFGANTITLQLVCIKFGNKIKKHTHYL